MRSCRTWAWPSAGPCPSPGACWTPSPSWSRCPRPPWAWASTRRTSNRSCSRRLLLRPWKTLWLTLALMSTEPPRRSSGPWRACPRGRRRPFARAWRSRAPSPAARSCGACRASAPRPLRTRRDSSESPGQKLESPLMRRVCTQRRTRRRARSWQRWACHRAASQRARDWTRARLPSCASAPTTVHDATRPPPQKRVRSPPSSPIPSSRATRAGSWQSPRRCASGPSPLQTCARACVCLQRCVTSRPLAPSWTWAWVTMPSSTDPGSRPRRWRASWWSAPGQRWWWRRWTSSASAWEWPCPAGRVSGEAHHQSWSGAISLVAG
mmetsp:Transcript_8236/g.24259  ORF Transcript_8236/g.24259 Transcript_8236/m.24259 type:complete len:323 (-) Transcript_8236:27-995(-)